MNFLRNGLIKHIWELGFCLLIFSACTVQDPAELQAKKAAESGAAGAVALKGGASYAVLIAPQDAVRGTTFYANTTGFSTADPRIVWTINGYPVAEAAGSQFNASEVKRGDIIQARVSEAGFTAESNSVEIKNTLPELTTFNVKFEFKDGELAYADVAAVDPDGDPVTISYEWTKNGEPAGNSQRLAIPLKRGDKISFKATPFDGIDYGKTAFSEKEIQNMPPVIEENKTYSFDGTLFTYQAKASDPDGDPLVYSLAGAPSGMVIDPATGFVKWVVPREFSGVANLTVTVQDGNNGAAEYTLKFSIK